MKTNLPDWAGCTALILASGPSLREFIKTPQQHQPEIRVIAVNSSVFAAPRAHVCFGVDFMWWKTHYRAVRADTDAQPWTTDRSAAERFHLKFVRGANEGGLHPTRVNSNGNSGAAAINFAVLTGVKRVLLLGFDMKLGPNEERHWHPDHPKPCTQAQPFEDWLYKFDALARDCEKIGVEVINCTPDSALKCFPVAQLKDVLCSNN